MRVSVQSSGLALAERNRQFLAGKGVSRSQKFCFQPPRLVDGLCSALIDPSK